MAIKRLFIITLFLNGSQTLNSILKTQHFQALNNIQKLIIIFDSIHVNNSHTLNLSLT